jgi:hypothetical protein
MNPTSPANPAPPTPAVPTPAPASAPVPNTLTAAQLPHLEWLADIGGKLAILQSSRSPRLKALGNDLIPLLVSEYQSRLPAVATAGKQARLDRANKLRAGMAIKGPGLWKTFHTRALAYRGADPITIQDELIWLRNDFRTSIGCAKCQVSYDEICRRIPPVLDQGARGYFDWTSAVHNEVNAKLNREFPDETQKIIYLPADALAIWAPRAA